MGGALSHTLGLQCIDDLLPVRSKGTKPMGQQQSERDREEGSDREGEQEGCWIETQNTRKDRKESQLSAK